MGHDKDHPHPQSNRFSEISAHTPLGTVAPPVRISGRAPTQPISRAGAYTYHYHRIHAPLHGAFLGSFNPTLMSYVVIRLATDTGNLVADAEKPLYSTLITAAPTIAMLFAPLFTWRNLDRYWLFAGFIGILLPSLLFSVAFEPWHMVVLYTSMRLIMSGFPGSRATIFARNYQDHERERLYGRAQMLSIVGMLAASLTFMSLMDRFPSAYRIVLPFAGVLGLACSLALYRLKRKRLVRGSETTMQSLHRGMSPFAVLKRVATPFQAAFRLMAENKEFRRYELGFFLYGAAFMMLLPFVPVFYDGKFGVNFKEFWVHALLGFHGVQFLMHWLLQGRHGAWSPPKMAGIAFLILLGYPSLLLVAGTLSTIWIAFGGFVMYGVGMTFVNYAWNLGPTRFANGGDPAPYSSAHVMMTGLRAIVAFPSSYLLMTFFREDYAISLIIPLTLLAIAAGVMFSLHRHMRKTTA